ncbi:MAG: ABC transporter ATP-binding protein [Ruminiclostridium sp.]|nr:ABC transporter ATP-binding protein [Ruminiclostridium sp.]
MEAILKLFNVSKSFGRKKVVDNISFEICAGEVFGFLGPNGAGKTTTIKMIMGFLSVDEGDVYINGFNVKKDYEKAMSNIGGIVENPEMYNNLSGLTNLQMYARLHDGVTKQRIDEVVTLVGMQNRIKEKMKKYSLGMKQRCGLAQAILHKPKLLILDEPTNGLDPAGIRELRDILKKLAQEENVAVFVSSHLLSEMELMCSRVAIINNGKILGVKTVKELLADATRAVIHRFMAKPVEKAVEILTPQYGSLIKTITDDYIDIEAEGDKVSEITALLATSGIGILGVSKIETSLEEAFINMTGGGNYIA